MLRKARILLQELGLRPRRLKAVQNLPYLVLECEMPDGLAVIDFPLNKLGRRVLREIYEHWLPGVDSGTIRLSHVLDVLLAFAPLRTVYENRSRIRRRTGLVRDGRLRNYIIWRRLKAKERFGGGRVSPAGTWASTPSLRDGDGASLSSRAMMASSQSPAGPDTASSSHGAGALFPYSSGRGRGDEHGLP